MARRRHSRLGLVLGAMATALALGVLVACSGLRVAPAGDGGTVTLGDGGTPDRQGDDDDGDDGRDGGRDGGEKPPGDAGRTCPVASDRPSDLDYVTTPDTVFDSVTKLMWERAYRRDEPSTFEEVATICTDLRTAGHADWRVPTRSELLSLVDYADSKMIDHQLFPEVTPTAQWTSSRHGPGADDTWLVEWFAGATLHRDEYDAFSPRVRCVRTVDPPCLAEPRFVRDDAVVADRVTGLEWSAEAGSPRDAVEATDYCRALAGDPARPWRVPSIKESDSLVVGTTADGFLPSAFPPASWKRYWTGTRSKPSGLETSYALDVSDGTIRELHVAAPLAVRCVR